MGCTRVETAYGAFLQSLHGVGSKTLFHLYEQFGGLEHIKEASDNICEKIMGNTCYKSWREVKDKNPLEYLERIESRGIRYIHFKDKLFPKRLGEIPDRPFGIYVLGSLPDPNKPSVAMVGARACSNYGQAVAASFASAFARAGIQTISGMARGIDSISHRETLKMGGTTYAVLGSGVDVCYPPELYNLYSDIQVAGGVISTYAPGMTPLAKNFPPRNRIISGLCDALLVIEAKEKSGTLITVDMALEQGKDVYAVPGRITDALSAGCNKLIGQGAGIAMDPSQMIEELIGSVNVCDTTTYVQQKLPMYLQNKDAELLVALIQEEELGVEEWFTRYKNRNGQKNFSQFMSLVTALEVDFVVYEKGAVYYFA